jgi:hypothetical protein
MKLSEKVEPVDLIAVICIIGGFILMACHIDTVVGGIVSLIAGYYFGHKRERENEELKYEKIEEQK